MEVFDSSSIFKNSFWAKLLGLLPFLCDIRPISPLPALLIFILELFYKVEFKYIIRLRRIYNII